MQNLWKFTFTMPDYVHVPEGIEELMPWSDKMKKLCAIDTKTRMEIQRSHDSKLVRSANIERLSFMKEASEMSAYNFYYDESEHSRKINYKTVSAENYYDNFVTVIVGWSSEKNEILQRYAAFEEKYADRKDRNGEIKSTMFQQKQFRYGFASLNKQNAQFVNDFLSLFDEESHIYFSVSSKIEYLVLQLFHGYSNRFFVDTDLMKYSITKALVMYRPQEILKCLYESPEDFLEKLKMFFRDRIERNEDNPELKQAETRAFKEILLVLDDISESPKIDWDYHMSFEGFKKYLGEKGIQNYPLVIDKEGKEEEESKTLKASREIGLNNSNEANSTKYPGLRMADMMAGIISKLMKGLCDSLRYQSLDEGISKKILDNGWFCLNEVQLELYKKLYRIICEWQPAWYKSYSGIYSDGLVVFNALLNFMNHFEMVEQIRADIDMQGEYFNAFACEQLTRYFEQRRVKLPIEPVIPFDEESYLNQRGGKVYFDSKKQPLLPLHGVSQTFEVLSVGVDQNFTPTVTILKDGESVCFRLPEELKEWACSVVGMALIEIRIFPAKVTFSKIKGKYDAKIL